MHRYKPCQLKSTPWTSRSELFEYVAASGHKVYSPGRRSGHPREKRLFHGVSHVSALGGAVPRPRSRSLVSRRSIASSRSAGVHGPACSPGRCRKHAISAMLGASTRLSSLAPAIPSAPEIALLAWLRGPPMATRTHPSRDPILRSRGRELTMLLEVSGKSKSIEQQSYFWLLSSNTRFLVCCQAWVPTLREFKHE